MHFSCLTAGTLLARLARPEVTNCILGLKQYNYAYEEAGEEAVEMERAYAGAAAGESDITHMASVVQGAQVSHGPQSSGHSGSVANSGSGGQRGQSERQGGNGRGSPRGQPMAVDSGPYPPPSANGSSESRSEQRVSDSTSFLTA